MAAYLGDIAEDAIIYFPWSTTDQAGGSVTRTVDGEVRVYKDDGTTQSTAGITDTEDFDSLTGVHMCKIDTSADAFYATGHDYSVVLQGATIDGETVNAVLAFFSIENRYNQIVDYDPPTKAELDTGLAGLNDLSGAEITTIVDTAIYTYDGPTKAELDTAEANIRGADSDDLKDISDQLDAVETDTQDVQSRLPATLMSGRMKSYVGSMGSNVINALSMAPNTITAGKIATGALHVAAFASPALEAIADKVLNRPISSVEPGAIFRTLYGAIASLVNKREIIAGPKIRTYKSDDSTTLQDLDLVEDSGQDPISSIDPV